MPKPVLLCVDDEAPVLKAVVRELRRGFGARVSLVAAESGEEALEVVRRLVAEGRALALVVSDQRMPGMSGVELLAQVATLAPDARRILLTAYTDPEATVQAINSARIHKFLTKPWEPAELRLLPPVSECLDAFFDGYDTPFEGLVVYGHRWSPEAYALRDFLTRQRADYRWVDLERDDQSWIRGMCLPVVELPDGERLENPSFETVMDRIGRGAGLAAHARGDSCDLLVIGGGPAGLAAAVYGASEGLSTILVERDAPGGQAGSSSMIENYLGFPKGVSGADLAARGREQAVKFGVQIVVPRAAESLRAEGAYRTVRLDDGAEISARAVVLATGVQWRRLDVPGEAELVGQGVYYGAGLSDAPNCRDETVIVVGGANSAGQAAMNFSAYAGRVVMLVRGPGLSDTMSAYLCDRIAAAENVEVLPHTEVAEFLREGERFSGVRTRDGDEIAAASAYVFIGAEPRTEWLDGVVARDPKGFVLTGADLPPGTFPLKRPPMILETSLPGVFGAGDVRANSVKRVASSVGQGSIAVQLVHQWLREVGA